MKTTSNLRSAAKLLTIPWAAWWTWFALAATAFSPNHTPQDIVAGTVAVTLFAVSASLVWWLEVPGAFLLAIEGIVVAVGYPMLGAGRMPTITTLFVMVLLGGVPLFSGVTILWSRFTSRSRTPA